MVIATKFHDSYIPEPNSGCWLWEGCLLDGYGQVENNGHMIAAHRYSYSLLKGHLIPGFLVCHHCDNRSCVNPDHLFLGTWQDNMDDMKRKGRAPNNKGLNNPNRKLGWPAVREIRRIGNSQPYNQTAKLFGVTPEMISSIIRNKSWIDK